MLKRNLLKYRAALLIPLAFSFSMEAWSLSYKEPAPQSHFPPYDDSLEGWDGSVPPCADGNLKPCWAKAPHYVDTRTWYPVVSFGAGAVLTSTVGQSQSFQIINPETDEFFDYTANKPSQTGALFELFLGSEWILDPEWNLQAGIDLDQVYTNYSSTGTVLQGADLQSADTYSYRFNVITRQVLAETKLLYTFRKVFHPYALLGIGAFFNTAYNYETSVPPFVTFTREFSDNSNNGLAYAAGLGLDIDINKFLRLGVGYRFTDLGKVSLGSASINGISVSGTLTQNHLYSNILMAQATLLF